MKNIMIFLILVGLVLLIGFSSNPSYADYKEWYKEEYNRRIGDGQSELEKNVTLWALDLINDNTTVREDYKVFSKYITNIEYKEFEVLGVFNNFFIINENISDENLKGAELR